jgi:hypothetical protein
MKTLSEDELRDAEKVLAKKYRGIVSGSLTNCTAKGRNRGKRQIQVRCPHCSKVSKTTTQELHHLRCEHCGESTQPKKRAAKGAK